MRNRGLVAGAVVGTALMAEFVGPQLPSPPELGVGPEMFDWSAGWLGSVSRVVVWILVLSIVIGAVVLARRIVGLRHPTAPSRRS